MLTGMYCRAWLAGWLLLASLTARAEAESPALLTSSDCSCAATPALGDTLTLVPVDFVDLPGWADDRHAEALRAFVASCQKLTQRASNEPIGVDRFSGRVRDWQRACSTARPLPIDDHAQARAFFEAEFRPYAAHGLAGPEGKLTGYYVQTLAGARTRHGAYQTPLYARPPELVSVDLTQFIDDARGRRLWGRLNRKTGAVEPYLTRAAIRQGALAGRGLELLWVNDPVAALFAEIEGSGHVTLEDGNELWLEFDGKNGHPYRGVGKILRDLGELAPGEGTMAGIRAWFERHPERRDEIIDRNPATIFFKVSKQRGAMGSQGVVLTPRRSLAVDRAFIAASTPIWVETRAPVPGERAEAAWKHLVIAQDTGGGIVGAVRGDVYWGDDARAAELGGRMGGPGRYWLLLPRTLRVPKP